jgi:hypothetical protein
MRWRNSVAKHWTKLNFGSVHTETIGDFHQFRAQVYLGVLEPETVLVELYANSQKGGRPFRRPMARAEALVGAVGSFTFAAQMPSTWPITEVVANLCAKHPHATSNNGDAMLGERRISASIESQTMPGLTFDQLEDFATVSISPHLA